MHLKTLSLIGFKSFADRTRVECEPGVTVVVGPNGSGKSNLVDAVAWVMGTQATSVLRTSRMDDIIFAGTALRPALGRAEVALTLDGGPDAPTDRPAEVTITRRLYRDGTSEYEINGVPCRLLDIQELLADAGVGRHQHVIVGQGRVDNILNSGPEEHRAVIEEAAGVVKHRARRDRSIRRLEATEIDLTRLRDILEEQQRRLKPLRRQAGAAAQYDGVRDEWRSLRMWIGGDRLRTIRSRLGAVAKEEGRLATDLAATTAERDAIVASLARLQAAAGESGEALERDTAAAARLETTAERLHSLALLARERRLHLERTVTGVAERRNLIVAEVADLTSRLEGAAAEELAASAAAERAEIALRALEDEERSLSDSDRLPAEGMAAALRGDLAALVAAESRDSRESADLARRRGAVAAFIDQGVIEAGRLGEELAAARHQFIVADAEKQRAETAAARERDLARGAEESAQGAAAALAAARARLEALESTPAMAGDPEWRERTAADPGVVGDLASRLDVPATLHKAAAAALGVWAMALVGRNPAAVDAALERIVSGGGGGVGVVAAVGDGSVAARGAALASGVGTAIVDLLGPRADLGLAAALLGDVVVVDAVPAARALVAAHPRVRAVTPTGDLVAAHGVSLALPAGFVPAPVVAAREAVAQATITASRTASRRTTAARSRDAAESVARRAAAAVVEIERRIGGLEEATRLLERSREEHTAELDRLESRSRALAEAAAQRAERVGDLRRRLAATEDGGEDQQALWDDLTRRREAVTARRDEARASREAAAAARAAAAERHRLLEVRRNEARAELESPVAGDEPQGVLRLEEVEAAARSGLESVRRHIDTLRQRQGQWREAAGTSGAKLEKARQRRETLTAEIEEAREAASRLAVEKAELQVREESALEALRREVDADEAAALAAPHPEIPEGTTPEAHADALGARLRRFGPINPLAAAEYRELAEQVAFLDGQLQDLEESRAELRKVIKALDDEIGRLFTEAFEDIAAKFAENFALLFPGGTGRLTLTDPEAVLESGVEVHAQPMGKKVSRLQLLSGGERSLTALAFLFAVFRSRPSPFYLLDEVEAALDDANLRRFLRLVETLRGTSQLVIVTHQQQTMEAADVLYGVTIDPGESSRVLAKRLSSV